jgi:signal transduction histidine kinase
MEITKREWSAAHVVFLVLFGGILLTYVIPGVSAEVRGEISGYSPLLLFPPLIWVLQMRRSARPEHQEERRFWNLLTAFFLLWVLGEVVISVLPETLALDLGSDFGYLGSYLALALAIQQKPHAPSGWSARSGSARFTGIATILFMAGMLAYFVVIPFFLDPESYATYVPTFYLFLTLDLLLASSLGFLCLRTPPGGWRRVYGALAGAMALWFVGDVLDYLYFAGQLEISLGTPLDLVFYAPVALVYLTTRVHVEPAEAEAEAGPFEVRRGEDELPSALPLSMAFLFPLLHLSVDNLRFLGEPSRDARELSVFVSLITLLGLMFVQQRFLNRRNRALRSRVSVLVTKEQVQEAQKMEALGRLAGSVAHEFNNALLVIRGYCDLILKWVPIGEPIRADVENIGRAADHVADLTRDLMAFGRRQPRTTTLVDLSVELGRCEDMLQRITGDDIEVVYQLQKDLPAIEIDAGQVVQVVMNLVINAQAAMPTGGQLTIGTHEVRRARACSNRSSRPAREASAWASRPSTGSWRRAVDTWT